MRLIFISLLIASQVSRAEPVVSEIDWKPACDGAVIEIVSEDRKILSIEATGFHAAVIVSWKIHCIDGIPVTAEYREWIRERISEGDRAGEYTGNRRLSQIQTWKWDGKRFPVADPARNDELTDILHRAREKIAPKP